MEMTVLSEKVQWLSGPCLLIILNLFYYAFYNFVSYSNPS